MSLSKNRRYLQRFRARSRELGHCRNCKNPPAPGKVRCVDCLRMAKLRYKRVSGEGLCQSCGLDAEGNGVWCKVCAEKLRPKLGFDYTALYAELVRLEKRFGQPWDSLPGDVAAMRIRHALRSKYTEHAIDHCLETRFNYLTALLTRGKKNDYRADAF